MTYQELLIDNLNEIKRLSKRAEYRIAVELNSIIDRVYRSYHQSHLITHEELTQTIAELRDVASSKLASLRRVN